ncbi:MAG: acetyl-CoA C-acetyltransferase [Corynebacterium casei]|uniref:acetyl-CoA C-acetyltransferase n=4 Tax=Corynebacterium casei TaxID=160386 RepID=UPI002647ED57|nr:acetyl-CoA C-acetyltransferase [Corynebacterium casei]MDN5729995.1 acetyl-CoA C-acetyltransferase [Corynebacterium casei]MDN5827256.1 acetyl-CoA C-acetyltransferase [Corynebacterium casei]MDN5885162.1 acetyl-CoA C-acetyltransferase [Corynebacterium casei]MDN5921739.1 acetyl-CoA C-acetyltransferase [Corynebacterium casei]MDN6245818.1 acetyl-CoA C-acetyltransferase [Corynebacterium casei]
MTNQNDNDIVFCSPLRTPVGRYGGIFRDIPVEDLATTVVDAIVERTGITAKDVDDIILGQASPNGAAPALGRIVALNSTLGKEVPGMQLDRRCGSGLQAVMTAAAHVAMGAADLIIAGGAESMSRTEYTVDGSIRWGVKGGDMQLRDRLAEARETAGGKNHPIPGGMIETAENVRREYKLTREAQDQMAAASHERALKAQAENWFEEEIVPVTIPAKKRGQEPTVVTADEGPREGSTPEKLASLRSIRGKQDEEATVTAGNASSQNDGAAAMIVTTRAKAAELGLTPMLSLKGWAVAGVAPETMGVGPVPATKKALERTGVSIDDLDAIELNEAFAAQALAVLQEWDLAWDDSRLNTWGSGISLGHPVGATGARMLVTLAHRLKREGGTLGLATMCIGGGQGMAAVVEKEG